MEKEETFTLRLAPDLARDLPILTLKDINARIKSDALGIRTEDYEKHKVDFSRIYTGYRELTTDRRTIEHLVDDKAVEPPFGDLLPNEFVILTDAQGRTVDFKNTIIIMTSNIGSPILLEGVTPQGEIREDARIAYICYICAP